MESCKYVRQQPIELSCQKICKKGSLIRYQLYEGLQKLILSVDRRCLKFLYNLFSRYVCFYDFKKANRRFWALACCGALWSRTVDHRCCPFLRRSSFCNFTFMETILNHIDSCPKARNRLPKRNLRATSSSVTSMVTALIGKAISAATVRRRLNMSGLYPRVTRVCVFLSIQSRGAWLKWCREHVSWTASD